MVGIGSVFFPFILDIKFVGRTTSRGHTGFLIHLLSAVRALILLARKIQPLLSLVVVRSRYEYSTTTVDNSTIETYRNRGLGK